MPYSFVKQKRVFFVLILSGLWVLQGGAVFKEKEDPIAKTQTDPVAYRDIIEESKDGPKGAPSPTFKLYERAGFFTDSPVAAKSEEKFVEKAPETLPEEEIGEDWWIEEETEPAAGENILEKSDSDVDPNAPETQNELIF